MKASATPPPVGGPVILDFYADWCGPCKTLTPKLEVMVTRSGGAVRLAKINVDEQQQIAQACQVANLPTVMLLHEGKVVDAFQGAVDDTKLKAFIDKAVGLAGGPAVGPKALEEAAGLLDEGDVAGATQAYAALMSLPELAAAARAGLAMCALKDDNLALAQDLCAEIHKSHAGDVNKPEVRKALSAVALAVETVSVGGEDRRPAAQLITLLEQSPRDHEARYELAQSLLSDGQHEDAIDHLLQIVRREKEWNEGAAKALLLKLFDSMGSESDVVKRGRRKLANYMNP